MIENIELTRQARRSSCTATIVSGLAERDRRLKDAPHPPKGIQEIGVSCRTNTDSRFREFRSDLQPRTHGPSGLLSERMPITDCNGYRIEQELYVV